MKMTAAGLLPSNPLPLNRILRAHASYCEYVVSSVWRISLLPLQLLTSLVEGVSAMNEPEGIRDVVKNVT